METEPIIIGVVVSLIVQGIKRYFGTNDVATLASVVAVSALGAIGFFYLKDTVRWNDFVSILATAGSFYTYIIRSFETTATIGLRK